VQVSYRLDAAGLTVRTTATNVGEGDCPFASGQHPYLSPGDGLVDECRLEVPARTRILTDELRQLPIGSEPVDGTVFDWRRARQVASMRLDDPSTDLVRAGDGRAWVRLYRPDGCVVELWMDRGYPIVELFTGDTLTASRRRRGLGVEPMSAPPNAFQSGEMTRLGPGESWTAEWGVRLVDR
jgi:aldose 1-epimerase